MFQNLHLIRDADATVVVVAWAVTLTWLAARGAPWCARAPVERWLVPGMFVAALGLRLALPWGPLNFVDGERLECLWGVERPLPDRFTSIPVLLSVLHDLGVEMATLMRGLAPVAGAAAVPTAYLAARSFGLRRESAVLAAAALGAWPAHLHYSTALTFSVEGAPFWLGAFAVAAPGGASTPWRPLVLTALTVLGVYARPEFRLLVVPLAVIVLGPGWTWKERSALALHLAVGLAPYLRHLIPDEGTLQRSGLSVGFVPRVMVGAALTPAWWIYAGLAGLVLPTTPRRNLRVALGLSIALLGASYWAMASEANPRWGQWRYYVTLVPFIAVAAGGFVEWALGHAPERLRRPWMAWVPVALALAPLPFQFGALRRAEDLPVEFDYLRASAARMTRGRRDVLLLANRGHEGLSGIAIEGNPTMAMATAVGPLGWPLGCEPTRSPLVLRDLERVITACPERIDPARTIVYLGLFRDEARLAALRARFDLVPVEEVTRTVALTSTMINHQCPSDPTGYTLEGPWGSPCRVRLGWYRLAPR
ncbi:MAG: hypothetical protein KA978_02335 [Deltaproteobacteria bacterium]|jgi:hypothetical protein|nr:hypothetical protein [Deltaproteobacteria bacterium]